jgi:hypothetical protein
MEIVDPFELAERLVDRPESLVLLDQNRLFGGVLNSRTGTLQATWRLLFHARLDLALRDRMKQPDWTPESIRQRLNRLGILEFQEARRVLQQDHQLGSMEDGEVYCEIVAQYLERRYFCPEELLWFFPSLRNTRRIANLFEEDVDAERICQATRMEADLSPTSPSDRPVIVPPAGRWSAWSKWIVSKFGFAFRKRAEEARSIGNFARSALLQGRVEGIDAARRDLGHLVSRLRGALLLTDEECLAWHEGLEALVRPSDQDYWSPEARILHELQTIAMDYEKGLYAIDLVEWVLWAFRRPLRRKLPLARQVSALWKLRRARKLVRHTQVPLNERERVASLLLQGIKGQEAILRGQLTPVITGALHEVDLQPVHLPERVARDKVVGELIDRVISRGFISFSDVRDVLARGQLKLADLSGPTEMFRGDQLLRADRRFAEVLDGIYRRAEFYLRWLQRLSSLFFGTVTLRFVTLFAIIPFGGGYLLLEFLQHVLQPNLRRFGFPPFNLMTWPLLVGVGSLILLLMHSAGFRSQVVNFLLRVGRRFRRLLHDLPRYLLALGPVRWVIQSPLMRFFRRRLLEATIVSLIALPVGKSLGFSRFDNYEFAGAVFCLVAMVFNTSVGHGLRESLGNLFVYLRSLIWFDVLLGMLRLVVEIFRLLAAGFERLLYSIDEWMRFNQRESKPRFAVKIVFGVVWYYVSYVARFVFSLLLEPQINPLKHFPTVTVAHKLILPMLPSVSSVLMQGLSISKTQSYQLATAIISGIPGIFGFLVWEFKENWRMYQSNRPKEFKPIIVGAHGENALRLLRPGFHSGTLPKLFRRLRSAIATGATQRRAQLHRELHEVEESLRRSIDRELIALLRGAPFKSFSGDLIVRVSAGVQRIEVRIGLATETPSPFEFALEEHAGKLLARVLDLGWVAQLSENEREAFACALLGWYHLADVSWVHEQLVKQFPVSDPCYQIVEGGLHVWSESEPEELVRYIRTDNGDLEPLLPQNPRHRWPILFAGSIDLTHAPLSWEQWVSVWNQDRPSIKRLIDWTLLPMHR